MSSFLNYVIEAGLSLGVFSLMYWFILRKETRFKATRYYLLFALLFSTLLPFLTIKIDLFNLAEVPVVKAEGLFSKTNLLETVTVYASGIPARVGTVLLSFNFSLMIYRLGAFAAFFVIAFGIFQLFLMVTKNRIFKLKRARLVVSSKEISPYSFFNYIFISKGLTGEENWKSMIYHELEHVKQGHSFDVLFIDFMMIFQWFNPFYWVLRRLVRENHEFLADTGVLSKGMISGAQYKKLLLSQAIGGRPVITSNFFNVKTVKKRFKMITKNNTKKYALIRYSMGVTMAIILALMFACEQTNTIETEPVDEVTYIYDGNIITKAEISKLGFDYITLTNLDKLDILPVYPDLDSKINTEKVALIVNPKDREQMQLMENLKLEDLTVTVVGYGKKLLESLDESNQAYDGEVFVIVEDMPEFPGGELALRKFIAQQVKYPAIAVENGIQGKVYVTFVVDQNGDVRNTKIARGVDSALDAEAIRVIESSPRWKPGMQRGQNVAVTYTVPINFALQ